MQVIKSQRGRDLIVINNFKFAFGYKNQNNVEVWRCVIKKCKAKITTNSEKSCMFTEEGTHNHNAADNIASQAISNSVKRKATEDLSEKPLKLIRSEIEKLPTFGANITYKEIGTIRRNIYRSRRGVLPPLPKNINDVHDVMDAIEIKTIRDELFLLLNCRNSNIITFSCDSNLKLLCECDTIFVDGTFSFCSKFFCQLFTIHIVRN